LIAAPASAHFLLAPGKSHLRLLPIEDSAARYLYRWLMAVTILATFGLLTCGVFRLAGASEADHFLAVTLVAVVLAALFIAMILGRRRQLAQVLSRDLPKGSLRHRLALRWHHFAIAGVVLLWISATINRLLGYGGQGTGIKTLLLIGLYFLLDWLLKQILEVAFGLAGKPDAAARVLQSAGAAAAEDVVEKRPQQKKFPIRIRPLSNSMSTA